MEALQSLLGRQRRILALDVPGGDQGAQASDLGRAAPTACASSPRQRAHRLYPFAEACSKICFGGPKRNRLSMTATQLLYAVYVEAQEAHIA